MYSKMPTEKYFDGLGGQLLEQFRQVFLTRHGIQHEKMLDCDKLTVLFLWRRDYLVHPRNPSGKVSRKVKNEDELISAVTDLLPGHDVSYIFMPFYVAPRMR